MIPEHYQISEYNPAVKIKISEYDITIYEHQYRTFLQINYSGGSYNKHISFQSVFDKNKKIILYETLKNVADDGDILVKSILRDYKLNNIFNEI